MLKKLLSLILLTVSVYINAQTVNIPDANFKNYLVSNSAINTNGDSEIQLSEASAFTGAIDCSFGSITNLQGIEAFTAITGLNCSNNSLNELNLDSNTQLTELTANNVALTSLNLSNNSQLNYLSCTNAGALKHLNIQNGNNINLNYLNTSNNIHLFCVQVDNEEAPNEEWITDIGIIYSEDCLCTVDFSDPDFEYVLTTWNWQLNANEDDKIQCYEAKNFTGLINCEWFTSITDMGGIEAFPNITELRCKNTGITELNLTSNTALISVSCEHNSLTSINLNNLQQLQYLKCNNNSLSSLDISTNIALNELNCYNNQLTALNISASQQLEFLDCNNNNLTSLDVSANSALINIYCGNNQLVSLDLSAQAVLYIISCYDNQLTALNLQNGNNENLVINAQNNYDLICVQVDDPEWSEANWSIMFPYWFNNAVTFSLDCGYNNVTIPDAAFLAYLLANTNINTNGDTAIDYDEAAAFSGTIECSGLSIEDLTGIEAFINITGLDCSDNLLTTLNVSSNTALITLDCSGNAITQLISGKYADGSNMQYNVLNLANNPYLQYLDCSDNQLTNLDISNNTALIFLDCSNNQLITLNAANTNNTNFTAFNALNNPALTCIQVDDDTWSTAQWANIDEASSFGQNCDLVGIADALLKNIVLYPNPASTTLSMQLPENVSINSVLVTDITGKVVKQQDNNETHINIQNLAAGYYIITVNTSGGSYINKFIKE